MKLLQNSYDVTHLTLGMLLQYLGKLKIQMSADIQPIWKKVQTNCILIVSNVVIRPQISIFSVLRKGVSLPILIANKIFHVTVFLVIYFCGIENSSQQISLKCLSTRQQSTWYSATRTSN